MRSCCGEGCSPLCTAVCWLSNDGVLPTFTALREQGESGIGAVKRSLPADTSYGQIKVVAALMQRRLADFAEAQTASPAAGDPSSTSHPVGFYWQSRLTYVFTPAARVCSMQRETRPLLLTSMLTVLRRLRRMRMLHLMSIHRLRTGAAADAPPPRPPHTATAPHSQAP